MKYQGIVLKLTKNRAIVSTNDFQCYYIKRSPTIYVGKEVEFTNKDIIVNKSVLIKPALSVACFIFVIACFLSISRIIDLNNSLMNPKVFAYISVDINPSFELEIDDAGNVLKLNPLNEDSKTYVNRLKIGKINVSSAIDIIISEAIKSNAINETEKDCVLISGTLNSKKEEQSEKYMVEKEKLDNMMDSLKESIERNGKANVYIVQADMDEREAARIEGVSTGRYVLYNKYKDLENEISFEEAKKADVDELIKGILEEEPGKEKPQETLAPTSAPMPEPTITSTSTPTSAPSPTSTSTSTLKPTPKSAPTSTPTPTLTPTPTPSPTPTAKIAYWQFMRFESSNYRGYYIRVKSFDACIDIC
ncbi:anti-sigma factor domain-containing protein [Acetivibrio straminisolvens]|uniref:Adhesion or S-layer protein n=1 Tax=Acetivibrio straminisolvens JCM 21531 TaxID=1294263 RepID=W4V8L5_9FIRM|nr:anti-sigma factor domain-containing protein [Acetivibrio straminisolvens]GAE89173.1 adhesion or S-layer protein [Acetivibrio straminisolvens JCM 21531]